MNKAIKIVTIIGTSIIFLFAVSVFVYGVRHDDVYFITKGALYFVLCDVYLGLTADNNKNEKRGNINGGTINERGTAEGHTA